jgi:hypothetical protein
MRFFYFLLAILSIAKAARGFDRPDCMPKELDGVSSLNENTVNDLIEYNANLNKKILPLPGGKSSIDQYRNPPKGEEPGWEVRYLCAQYYNIYRNQEQASLNELDFSLNGQSPGIEPVGCFNAIKQNSDQTRFLIFLNQFFPEGKQFSDVPKALTHMKDIMDIYVHKYLENKGHECIGRAKNLQYEGVSYTSNENEVVDPNSLVIPFIFGDPGYSERVRIVEPDGSISIYPSREDADYFAQFEKDGNPDGNSSKNKELERKKDEDCEDDLRDEIGQLLAGQYRQYLEDMNELLDLKVYYLTKDNEIDIAEIKKYVEGFRDEEIPEELLKRLERFKISTDYSTYAANMDSDRVSVQGLMGDGLIIELARNCPEKDNPETFCLNDQDLMIQGFLGHMRRELEKMNAPVERTRPNNILYRIAHYQGVIAGAGGEVQLEDVKSRILEKQAQLQGSMDYLQAEINRLANECFLRLNRKQDFCVPGLLNEELINLYQTIDTATESIPSADLRVSNWDDYTYREPPVEPDTSDQVNYEDSTDFSQTGGGCYPRTYTTLENLLNAVDGYEQRPGLSSLANLAGSGFAYLSKIYQQVCEGESLYPSMPAPELCDHWALIKGVEEFVRLVGNKDSVLLKNLEKLNSFLSEGFKLMGGDKFYLGAKINKLKILPSFLRYCCGEKPVPLTLVSFLWGGIDLKVVLEVDVLKVSSSVVGGPIIRGLMDKAIPAIKNAIAEQMPEGTDIEDVTKIAFQYKFNFGFNAKERISSPGGNGPCPKTSFKWECPVETSFAAEYEINLGVKIAASAGVSDEKEAACVDRWNNFSGFKLDLSILGINPVENPLHVEAQFWNWLGDKDIYLRDIGKEKDV